MKRRIILRIVLGLVIILALVLGVTKVIIPLFDTSDEVNSFEPDIQRYSSTDETFTMENEYLTFTLDKETTHFTLKTADGHEWSSAAAGSDLDNVNLTPVVEKYRLTSVLTVECRDKKGTASSMNTSQNSTPNALYTLEKLEDGSIMVNYTIGNIQPIYLYPSVILVEDLDAMIAEAGLSKSETRKITDLYKAYDPSAKNYAKTKGLAELEETYPVLKEGKAIYVLRKAKADEKNKSTLQKNVAAFEKLGYTEEMLERDDALIAGNTGTDYSKAKIVNVSVIYRLEGNDLVVEVPFDKISYNPDYPITKLNLLPAFGSTDKSAEGFILVPEGSGAIINFNNGKVKQSPYAVDVYGYDYATSRHFIINEPRVSYPVFGMSQAGNGSFLCILEDGKSWASIQANSAGQPSYGAFNSAGASYIMLHGADIVDSTRSNDHAYMYEKELPEGSIIQRYRFIGGESYMDMAAAYRTYLQATNPQLLREVSSEAHTVVEMVGAIDKVQQVFGVPTDVPIPMTTYAQASDLAQRLIAEGLPNLSIRYAGWMNGGLNQTILNKVRLMSEMGSTAELEAFTQLASDANVPLYLDGLTCFARNSGLLEGFIPLRDAARFATRKEAEIPEYSPIWYGEQEWRDNYFLLKPSVIQQNVDVLSQAANDYHASGVSFRDIGLLLSADYNPKDHVNREEVRLQQMQKLTELREAGQLVMTRNGNDYAAVLSDIVTDMDLDGAAYQVIDQFVPFYTAALHGSVPYTGVSFNLAEDRETLLLRSAEMGASLQYTLMAENVNQLQDSWFSEYYGADASRVYGEMIGIVKAYNDCLSGTFNQMMTAHKSEGDVTVTEYENGTRIYVNYGYDEATVDGVTIAERSVKSIATDGTEKTAFVPAEETAKEGIE